MELEQDEKKRMSLPVTHYYASFEYTNGFKKVLVWSKEKMEEHARTYSKAFQRDLAKNTDYSFWSKHFDAMAFKTMLRQLLSKWGILSVDLQKAFETDEMGDQNDYMDMPDVINTTAEPSKEEVPASEFAEPSKEVADPEKEIVSEADDNIITAEEKDVESAFFD